ncbi:hypothetical protein AAG570_012040 [Ranatra chinensis]|uniref:PQ-loop repeat-containing protein 3 n=1 Tax=Ranatra chinensis TaxID=642074 RepID=A0ABD0Z5Y4_9HEMI
MAVLHVISDILSVVTISMCLFLKVPQIVNINRLNSAKGMNVYSLALELVSYTTTACYNYVNDYSILSYLEYPIIIAQEYVLIYLVLFYEGLIGGTTMALFSVYFTVTAGLVMGVIPGTVLLYAMPLCTPISLSSKAIQLWEILRKQNADSISVSTWVISAATNLSRIYTVLLDSADGLLLTNFGLSTIMSGSIAISAYILQKGKTKIN